MVTNKIRSEGAYFMKTSTKGGQKMTIDIAILDYAGAKVRLVSCDVPDNYTNETIAGELELLGYKMATTSFMTATNIELSDEREKE